MFLQVSRRIQGEKSPYECDSIACNCIHKREGYLSTSSRTSQQFNTRNPCSVDASKDELVTFMQPRSKGRDGGPSWLCPVVSNSAALSPTACASGDCMHCKCDSPTATASSHDKRPVWRVPWRNCGGVPHSAHSSGDDSCNLYCRACSDLGGALLCRECGPRPDGFMRFYRTSYLYKTADACLTLVEFMARPFCWDMALFRSRDSATSGRLEPPSGVLAGMHLATARRCTQIAKSEHPRSTCKIRRGSRNEQSLIAINDQALSSQQIHTLYAKWEESGAPSQPPEGQRPFQQLPGSHGSDKLSKTFWVAMNHLDHSVVRFARRHPLLIWLAWGLLSLGFLCSLNGFLWPILILLFVLRRLRLLMWEAAVRWFSPYVFSKDVEAFLHQPMHAEGQSVVEPQSSFFTGSREVLSLMESQEKLFFSMPWMAVTAFSYCERLTLQDLCSAITTNLLKPVDKFSCFADCSADDTTLGRLPLSAFAHPRLLAKVQRIMGRYCWVRQEGFRVSQHVMKLTRKGLESFRDQRFVVGKGSADSKEMSQTQKLCSCSSASDCSCLLDEADVTCLVNEALAQPLDPGKPLWQFLLIENVILPPRDGAGSLEKECIGSVVVFRMHHAVGDGVSITRMFLRDFLCAAPAVPCNDCTSAQQYEGQTVSVMGAASLPDKGSATAIASQLSHTVSADTSGDNDVFHDNTEEAAQTPKVGSPVSAASTSTIWTASVTSSKAAADANETTNDTFKAQMQDRNALQFRDEGVLSKTSPGVSPLKTYSSVCAIPQNTFWKVLLAIRFALQIPFYAAQMALLMSYDELLETPRCGSARRTRIAKPICIPLQELKDLKTRLAAVLALQRETQPATTRRSVGRRLLQWIKPFSATQDRQQMDKKQSRAGQDKAMCSSAGNRGALGATAQTPTVREEHSNAKTLRVTLNDIFAACIVGGYHRYEEKMKKNLSSNEEKSMEGSIRAISKHPLKEEINFLIPVNLRRQDHEAKDLRNRFASLVLQMPVTSQGDSLQRMLGVHGAIRKTFQSFAIPMVMCLENWLYNTWPDLLMAYFLRLTHKISVIFSSVIGPASLPYVHCSRAQSMHFVVPQPGEVGVGVSAFSCGGVVSICISADEGVVSDPQVLRECVLAEYASLCQACKQFEPFVAVDGLASSAITMPLVVPS